MRTLLKISGSSDRARKFRAIQFFVPLLAIPASLSSCHNIEQPVVARQEQPTIVSCIDGSIAADPHYKLRLYETAFEEAVKGFLDVSISYVSSISRTKARYTDSGMVMLHLEQLSSTFYSDIWKSHEILVNAYHMFECHKSHLGQGTSKLNFFMDRLSSTMIELNDMLALCSGNRPAFETAIVEPEGILSNSNLIGLFSYLSDLRGVLN